MSGCKVLFVLMHYPAVALSAFIYLLFCYFIFESPAPFFSLQTPTSQVFAVVCCTINWDAK